MKKQTIASAIANPIATIREIEKDPILFANIVLQRKTSKVWKIHQYCSAMLRGVEFQIK